MGPLWGGVRTRPRDDPINSIRAGARARARARVELDLFHRFFRPRARRSAFNCSAVTVAVPTSPTTMPAAWLASSAAVSKLAPAPSASAPQAGEQEAARPGGGASVRLAGILAVEPHHLLLVRDDAGLACRGRAGAARNPAHRDAELAQIPDELASGGIGADNAARRHLSAERTEVV